MLIEEIVGGIDEKRVWAKSGNKLVKKFRVASGPRKGRLVSNPKQAHAPKNLKKSRNLKKTKAKSGFRMKRKIKKSKRYNPISKRVRSLNK